MHPQHPRPAALHPLALAVLLALGGTLAHTPAHAQSAVGAQTTAYDLPAGPLDATLAFGRAGFVARLNRELAAAARATLAEAPHPGGVYGSGDAARQCIDAVLQSGF